jgi:hypothetical protein
MIDKFLSYLEGTFDNKTQAYTYPGAFGHIQITHKIITNNLVYGEQGYVYCNGTPYRQFVLEIFQDDNFIIVQNYKLNNPEKFLGFNNLNLMTSSDISLNEKCNIYFTERNNIFYGESIGCECYVNWSNTLTYLQTYSHLSSEYYFVEDIGISMETGKQIWGSRNGKFHFYKIK